MVGCSILVAKYEYILINPNKVDYNLRLPHEVDNEHVFTIFFKFDFLFFCEAGDTE